VQGEIYLEGDKQLRGGYVEGRIYIKGGRYVRIRQGNRNKYFKRAREIE